MEKWKNLEMEKWKNLIDLDNPNIPRPKPPLASLLIEE
jgi:hypothetical protein